jgi:hypothetical protein
VQTLYCTVQTLKSSIMVGGPFYRLRVVHSLRVCLDILIFTTMAFVRTVIKYYIFKYYGFFLIFTKNVVCLVDFCVHFTLPS